jgi:hypothetical protein
MPLSPNLAECSNSAVQFDVLIELNAKRHLGVAASGHCSFVASSTGVGHGTVAECRLIEALSPAVAAPL